MAVVGLKSSNLSALIKSWSADERRFACVAVFMFQQQLAPFLPDSAFAPFGRKLQSVDLDNCAALPLVGGSVLVAALLLCLNRRGATRESCQLAGKLLREVLDSDLG